MKTCTKRFRGNVADVCSRKADRILEGLNHGPFGEKNFFIPDGHWRYGPGRAMWRLLAQIRSRGPLGPARVGLCAGLTG